MESDHQQLQIPQSSVVSYFTESPSGKWEIQMPEDQALPNSHRRPIGFVTTGFVRGRQVCKTFSDWKRLFIKFLRFSYNRVFHCWMCSKKATAAALCEASLLSNLREEQWKAVPVRRRRKEIFVLVRNMRSTAYRLALATIVLEQQDKDVDFMWSIAYHCICLKVPNYMVCEPY